MEGDGSGDILPRDFISQRELRMEGDGSGDILTRDFISKVLTFTTPRDVCRASEVSTTFQLAADSDFVWGRFLPDDYADILSRALHPVHFSCKKELYFRLCEPVLIDDGIKSFALDKATGKKCYMVGARALWIVWVGDNRYWRFISLPEARFAEVALLVQVCWLDMGAEISTSLLSPETTYGAYLIFKLDDTAIGFEFPAQQACITIRGDTSYRNVFLQPNGPRAHEDEDEYYVPHSRDDGWMEIEMGEFYNVWGQEAVCVKFSQIQQMNWKQGLIIEGVELRPKGG